MHKFNPGIRFLKVKVKTMAREAKIIRAEERKALNSKRNSELFAFAVGDADRKAQHLRHARAMDQLFMSLRAHRIFALRDEARVTHFAYALLRGRRVQNFERESSDGARILAMVKKYGTAEDLARFNQVAQPAVAAAA